jgi:CheY-like chemotaxis protein
VVLNFLTNAEHALRGVESERRITLATRRADNRVIASVSDTGPGIPPETLDHIFNPFFTTKPVGEGTGLGLSISDGIVRQHGGQITVHSTPGHGATFSIELPTTTPSTQDGSVLAEEELASAAPRLLLIVDDEPSIRAALSRYLEREGHTVDAVATGTEAFQLLRERRYDGILLDLRMPDQSGAAVYAELMANDPEHAERVVFATGDVESDAAREFLRAARRPYVSKPFVLPTVAHLLCNVARR